jgi:hypothetical protein
MFSARFRHFAQDDSTAEWEDRHKPTHRDAFGKALIGASSVPNIVGVGYHSCIREYDLRMGLVEKENQFSDLIKLYGKQNEPTELKLLGEEKNLTLFKTGSVFSVEWPWLYATPDSLALHKNDLGNPYELLKIVEVKVNVPDSYIKGGNPKPFPSSTEDIKDKWLVQIMIQLGCFQLKNAILRVCKPSTSQRITFEIKFNQELYHYLLDSVVAFHQRIDNESKPPRMSEKSRQPLNQLLAQTRKDFCKIWK